MHYPMFAVAVVTAFAVVLSAITTVHGRVVIQLQRSAASSAAQPSTSTMCYTQMGSTYTVNIVTSWKTTTTPCISTIISTTKAVTTLTPGKKTPTQHSQSRYNFLDRVLSLANPPPVSGTVTETSTSTIVTAST
jgi:hypothetical protein